MTKKNDHGRFAQRCHKFQVRGDLIKVPPHELNAMSSPWPFSALGMEIIGPIEPSASNFHKIILVASDYVTKWVEVGSYKVVMKKVVANFIFFAIFDCHLGVPMQKISIVT